MSDDVKKADGVSAVASNELLALAAFLCSYITELDALRYKVYSWKPEQGDLREYLIGQWPVIQGTRNQMNIDKIGTLPWESKDVAAAVDSIIKANSKVEFQERSAAE